MEKIVKTGRTAVFTLDGTECRLTFPQKYRGFDIENRSDGAYNFYRFAVYDKALTAAEIAQNYNADTARFDI